VNQLFKLKWKFANDHEWEKEFETQEEALEKFRFYGLDKHPSCVYTAIVDSDGTVVKSLIAPALKQTNGYWYHV